MIREYGKVGNAVYEYEEGSDACVIHDPRTPRHWYNYLWNELGYCAQVSQLGHGRSYYINDKAQMCMLNKDAARYVYLRDEESKTCWNIGYGPLNTAVEDYYCKHAIGYSELGSSRDGIAATWKICVPVDLYGELWILRLVNRSGRDRAVSVFETVSFSMDGFDHPRYYEMYRTIETAFEPELNGMLCHSSHPFAPHARYQGYLAASEEVVHYDGDLTAFVGPENTRTESDTASSALYQRPAVVMEGKDCTDSEGALFIPGAVLQHRICLRPGEEKEIRVIFGAGESKEEIYQSSEYFLRKDRAEETFARAQAHYSEKYSGISAVTPDEKINRILNTWVKKQVDFCIVGKKGVRDNLQIAAALLQYRPEKAKEEILECLRHQFRDGHTVLTWYPYDDTRYSDQPFWIIWAVCRLIKETGDMNILDLPVEWQDGGMGTVMEHVRSAVLCLLADKGRNGLVRIRYADWNDALNIPEELDAESVMLSEQACLAFRELGELTIRKGDEHYAEFLSEAYEQMKSAINRAAWDGEWYARALTPEGNIGSANSSGSRIYLNAQTWAILSGVAEGKRKEKILRQIDAMERDFGFPLNDPPYMQYDPLVGRMSGMLPGLYENGGVYCHASAFKQLMDCRCARAEEALRTLKKIMPDSEWNPSSQSGAEPYVFTNCYSVHPKYFGRSYQSWTTGTSAWSMRCLYEGILGVNADYEGLRIEPCFPDAWDHAEVTRQFRGTVYRIVYRRKDSGKTKTVTAGGRSSTGRNRIDIFADGKKIGSTVLPDYRDGKIHNIEVVI